MLNRWPAPGRCSRHDDTYIRTARSCALRFQHTEIEFDRQALQVENPGFFYAFEFHQRSHDNPSEAMYVQARILAGQSSEEIADILGIHPLAIEWYEAMFFNVRDKLNNRDYITRNVILPAILSGQAIVPPAGGNQPSPFRDSTVAKPFMDGSLKMFAYFGGPHVADVFIAGLQHGHKVSGREEVATWLDGQFTMSVRRRSAQTINLVEINKYNAMELMAVHTQIMALSASQDSRDQARTTIDRHIEQMVNDIPWAVGEDGARIYDMKIIGRLDEMAGELRDDELLKLASGRPVEGLTEEFPSALPAPRKVTKVLAARDDSL